jgi:hypothetical protein
MIKTPTEELSGSMFPSRIRIADCPNPQRVDSLKDLWINSLFLLQSLPLRVGITRAPAKSSQFFVGFAGFEVSIAARKS